MKVRMTLDADNRARYVIARYFGVASAEARDRQRPRATRAQVRRFAQAALRKAVKEYAENMRGRQRATARRLAEPVAEPELPPPAEQQPELAGL